MQLASQLETLLKTPFLSSPLIPGDLNALEGELNNVKDFNTSSKADNLDSLFYLNFVVRLVNALDQLFFDVISAASSERQAKGFSALQQLLSFYQRAASKSNSSVLHWNLSRFVLSYCGLVLTVPGLFEGGIDSDAQHFIDLLVRQEIPIPQSFWSDLAGALDTEVLEEVLNAVIGAAAVECKTGGLLDARTIVVMNAVFAPICQVPQLAAIILRTMSTASPSNPAEAEQTFLGKFFAVAAVDAPGNFEPIRSLLPPGYEPPIALQTLLYAYDTVRAALQLYLQTLHENILLPLIRNNPHFDGNPKNVLIKQLFAISSVNKNRSKLQADAATINSDGFIMAAWYLLLRFCDPFTLAGPEVVKSKLQLIDVNFCFTCPEWQETDRSAMNLEEFKSFAATATTPPADYNFITQVFFATLNFCKIGPLRLIQEYGTISREFIELEQEQKRLQETRSTWSRLPNAPMIERFLGKIAQRMRELVDLRIAFDLHLQESTFKRSTLALLSFFARFYGSLNSKQRSALPEFFLEGLWEYLLFMCRVDPDFMSRDLPDDLLQLGAEQIPDAESIKNPYIRAKIAEVFFAIVSEEKLVLLSPPVMEMLVPNMMRLYVQVEALGSSTAFYDKFSIRYHISRVLFKLLHCNPAPFHALKSTLDDATFVRFLNLCVSDSTYLLDESLSKLAEIKEKEQARDSLSPEDLKLLAQTERQAQSLLALGTESLQFMALFSSTLPSAFLRPEILDRLTAMLNFNLVLLAGPRCSALKVQNPGKYHFNPRALLSYLLEIYLSLADREEFIKSVGADERSFSPQLFASVQSIMRRTGMDSERIEAFGKLAARVNQLTSIKADSSAIESEEIPEEFLDPILFTLMTDPVKLPASQMIVDRATIQAHLLNDPHDPFNRQPLSLEEVLPCTELKARIESFLQKKA